jgi:hypothetical protein
MTNKSTSFKRVALALVAALGFGVLSTGSSHAYFSAASTTLGLSAATVSAAPGETVTVTGTLNFVSTHVAESINVRTYVPLETFSLKIRDRVLERFSLSKHFEAHDLEQNIFPLLLSIVMNDTPHFGQILVILGVLSNEKCDVSILYFVINLVSVRWPKPESLNPSF